MDVAVLGEICNGHEVVRYLAGDGGSFGLTPGASMPIEDTYCHRLLTGRLSNVVPDAQANEQVRDLEITHAARIRAYIGVPLTGLDARLYVLCCLAHEQRPRLGERDVLFLRDLGNAVLANLELRQTRPQVFQRKLSEAHVRGELKRTLATSQLRRCAQRGRL